MQTRVGASVTGEFHEVTTVSYDEKERRQEVVTFAEQPSLRGIELTRADMEDIRTFMPLMLTREDLPQYSLSYEGQQHVDDLDTYVFHAVPKKLEKDRRYFEARLWIDGQDFQIVKVCGKSAPENVAVKEVSDRTCIPCLSHTGDRWMGSTGFQPILVRTTRCTFEMGRYDCVKLSNTAITSVWM